MGVERINHRNRGVIVICRREVDIERKGSETWRGCDEGSQGFEEGHCGERWISREPVNMLEKQGKI